MKNIFKLKTDKHRVTVLEYVRQYLYPLSDYPDNMFPDLPVILYQYFIDTIKKSPVLKNIYEKDDSTKEIENIARERLLFNTLLHDSPETVVLLYRTYIKKFVKYKANTHPKINDWEDVFQEVITRLISGKIHRIRQHFDFEYQENSLEKKSFFTSYLMVTVRNIYMDIIRERNIRPLTGGQVRSIDEVLELSIHEDENMLNRLAIKEEFDKFHTLLNMYGKIKPKLELCLKLKCRILLDHPDILRCFPLCSPDDIRLMRNNFKNVNDKLLFDSVTPVFNRNEECENKSDTLRKWVSVKIDEITSHLNRTHSGDVYNSKNFPDFLALYYQHHDQLQASDSHGGMQ